jgi:hypothetical protein
MAGEVGWGGRDGNDGVVVDRGAERRGSLMTPRTMSIFSSLQRMHGRKC